MVLVKFNATVEEDRQLHIALPDDMPLGPVEVTVKPIAASPETTPEPELTREQWRERFAAAGLPSTARYAPPDAKPLSEEEREELAQLYSGEPGVSDMIIEDRRDRWD
ncbi:MAG: hypothetical protein U0841_24790 [Chloroflexia bacterium]